MDPRFRSFSTPRSAVRAPVVVCAMVTLAASSSRLVGFHDSDSLLLPVISLQQWTPYYWGQARWGMLLPGLVSWIHDPMANLLVQTTVMAFAGAAVPFLLAHQLRPRRSSFVIGTVALAIFVLTSADYLLYCYFLATPYGMGLALAFLGLHVFDRPGARNAAAGTLLLVLSAWVCLATMTIALGVLVGTLWRTGTDRRRVLVQLGVLALVTAAAAWLAPRIGVALPGETEVLSPLRWPAILRDSMARASLRAFDGPMPASIALLAMAALMVLGLVPRRGRRAHLVRWLVPLAGGCIAYVVLLIASTWVQLAPGPFIQRYMMPLGVLGAVGAAAAVVHLIAHLRISRPHRHLVLATAPLLLAVVWLARVGVESPGAAYAQLLARAPMEPAAVEIDAPLFVAGDYWLVWRGVFFAMVFRSWRSDPTPVYGLTMRASAAGPLWTGTTPRTVWTLQLEDDAAFAPALATYLDGDGCLREEVRGRARLCLVESPTQRAPVP